MKIYNIPCLIIFSLMILLTGSHARGSEVCVFDFSDNSYLAFTEPTDEELKKPYFTITAVLSADNKSLTYNNDWTIKKLDHDTYAIKFNSWTDSYWIARKSTGRVVQIDNKTFASEREGSLVPGVSVELIVKYKTFMLKFHSAHLELDRPKITARYLTNNKTLLEPKDWEVMERSYGVYHIRRPMWASENYYWEYDAHTDKFYFVRSGSFSESAPTDRTLATIPRECK